jgi:hypothetical protein
MFTLLFQDSFNYFSHSQSTNSNGSANFDPGRFSQIIADISGEKRSQSRFSFLFLVFVLLFFIIYLRLKLNEILSVSKQVEGIDLLNARSA